MANIDWWIGQTSKYTPFDVADRIKSEFHFPAFAPAITRALFRKGSNHDVVTERHSLLGSHVLFAPLSKGFSYQELFGKTKLSGIVSVNNQPLVVSHAEVLALADRERTGEFDNYLAAATRYFKARIGQEFVIANGRYHAGKTAIIKAVTMQNVIYTVKHDDGGAIGDVIGGIGTMADLFADDQEARKIAPTITFECGFSYVCQSPEEAPAPITHVASVYGGDATSVQQPNSIIRNGKVLHK